MRVLKILSEKFSCPASWVVFNHSIKFSVDAILGLSHDRVHAKLISGDPLIVSFREAISRHGRSLIERFNIPLPETGRLRAFEETIAVLERVNADAGAGFVLELASVGLVKLMCVLASPKATMNLLRYFIIDFEFSKPDEVIEVCRSVRGTASKNAILFLILLYLASGVLARAGEKAVRVLRSLGYEVQDGALYPTSKVLCLREVLTDVMKDDATIALELRRSLLSFIPQKAKRDAIMRPGVLEFIARHIGDFTTALGTLILLASRAPGEPVRIAEHVEEWRKRFGVFVKEVSAEHGLNEDLVQMTLDILALDALTQTSCGCGYCGAIGRSLSLLFSASFRETPPDEPFAVVRTPHGLVAVSSL